MRVLYGSGKETAGMHDGGPLCKLMIHGCVFIVCGRSYTPVRVLYGSGKETAGMHDGKPLCELMIHGCVHCVHSLIDK